MAVCESCGAKIQEGLTVCSQCGKPMVKMKTSLSLKGENGKKAVKAKAFSPADDFGDIYDDNSIGGKEPVEITKEDIKEKKAEQSGPKRPSGVAKFFGILVKLAILAVIGFGIYYLITEVIMKPKGPETYQAAIDVFKAAVNENDEEKLLSLVPEYITANKALVQDIMPMVKETEYTTITVIKETKWSSADISKFNDRVQMQHIETVDAKDGVTLKLGLRGNMKNASGIPISYMEVEIDFVKIRGVWYPDIEMVKEKLFTKK